MANVGVNQLYMGGGARLGLVAEEEPPALLIVLISQSHLFSLDALLPPPEPPALLIVLSQSHLFSLAALLPPPPRLSWKSSRSLGVLGRPWLPIGRWMAVESILVLLRNL